MFSVLQLISSRGYYGAESMLVALSKALRHAGCRVTVSVFRDGREPHLEVARAAEAEGLDVHVVPCAGRWDRSAAHHLSELARAKEFDIVHTHGYKSNIYALAALRSSRAALVSTCHNWPAGARILSVYSVLDRLLLRGFHRVATPSPVVARLLHQAHIAGRKIYQISNGVEIDRFTQGSDTLRSALTGARRPVIGFVGRMVDGKGGSVLLEAAQSIFQLFPNAAILMVGEGPRKADWQQQAQAAGLGDGVVFTGARRDMPDVYAAMDMMALPSLEEAMPMCVLEAMAAGVPVVATRVGAIPEIVEDQVTGLLVEPGDARGLTNALTTLGRNPEHARGIGEAGHKAVARSFSSDAMATRYLELYRQASEERSRSGWRGVLAGGRA